jgi:hypothetical protein
MSSSRDQEIYTNKYDFLCDLFVLGFHEIFKKRQEEERLLKIHLPLLTILLLMVALISQPA